MEQRKTKDPKKFSHTYTAVHKSKNIKNSPSLNAQQFY